jgi:hypothetical protein
LNTNERSLLRFGADLAADVTALTVQGYDGSAM